MKSSARLVALAVPLLVLACDRQESATVGRTGSNLSASNGTTFNGISYGGYSVQTTYLSTYYAPTMFYYPTSYAYVNPLAGIAPNGPSTSGSELSSVDLPEDLTSAFDLIGTRLSGVLEGGGAVDLDIENATLEDGFFRYQVAVTNGDARASLCGEDADGNPIEALAVPGVWDMRAGAVGGGSWSAKEGEFTFACRGSSIAKCVELGYGPDLENGTVLDGDYLMACVRMLRADYCGDGSSWTTNGRLIDVWDDKDINVQTEDTWELEAGWGPWGAVCLTDPRYSFPEDSAVPFCETRLKLTDCGWWEEQISILFNSFPRDGADIPSGAVEEPEAETTEETPKTWSWTTRWGSWGSWNYGG